MFEPGAHCFEKFIALNLPQMRCDLMQKTLDIQLLDFDHQQPGENNVMRKPPPRGGWLIAPEILVCQRDQIFNDPLQLCGALNPDDLD